MDCIFCSIVDRENEAYTVYEDKEFVAFLDINPVTRGHTLVIPKEHIRWPDEVPNFGAYFEAARKIGNALKKVFAANPVYYQTMGFGISHAHLHVIPRYPDDGHGEVLDWDKIQELSKEEMAAIAAKLRKALK